MPKASDSSGRQVNLADAREVAALVARFRPALQRYFHRKAGAAADDLAQEVFVRLQSKTETYPIEDTERFIFTVAKRVLIDHQRFEIRRGLSQYRSFNEDMDGSNELSPERILSAKQEYASAIEAIMHLPPRMQQAFVLHRFGKLSYSEIAHRMGVSKPTVQTLIDRSMKRIVQTLRDKP